MKWWHFGTCDREGRRERLGVDRISKCNFGASFILRCTLRLMKR
jgi:hypothetical protein